MALTFMADKPELVHVGEKFQTSDGTFYKHDRSGALRRQVPKTRGKSARRAAKRARHQGETHGR